MLRKRSQNSTSWGKKKHIKRGVLLDNVRLNWFFTYGLVLLIPLIVSLFIYNSNINVVKRQSEMAGEAVLRSASTELDAWKKACYNVLNKISNNNSIHDSLENLSNHYYKIMISDYLSAYKEISNSIKEVTLFMPEDELIISSETSSNSDLYFQTLKNDGYIGGYEDWKMLYGAVYRGNFVIAQTKDSGQLLYLYSVSYGGGNKYFNVIISLDNLYVNQNISSFFPADTVDFVITDPKNTVLYNVSGKISVGEILQKNNWQNSQLSVMGQTYMCFENNTVLDGFSLQYLIPEKTYLSEVTTMRKSIGLTLIWCAVLGIIMIWLFVKRNYKPIQNILADLSGTPNTEEDKTSNNEYVFIRNAIRSMYKMNRNMESQLTNQKKMVRNNLLAKVIKQGSIPVLPEEKELSDYDIYFIGARFAVTAFYLEDISKLFCEEEISEEEQVELSHLIIENIMTELAGKFGFGYVLEVDELLVCLWNFGDEKESSELKREVKSVCRQCQEFIYSNFDIQFTIAVSDIHVGYDGLRQCFMETLTALEYRLLNGTEQILDYEEVADRKETEYQYPLRDEQKLLNSILAGDFELSIHLADEVFHTNLEKQNPSVQVVKLMLFDMAGTLYKAIREMRLGEEEDQIRLIVNDIFECETLEKAKEKIHEILKILCECFDARKDTVQNILVRRVTDYIAIHYAEDSLGVAGIAEHFGITPNYLSKIYKEVTGERLLNDIHSVRLEKAKELLKTTPSMTIEEIANAVGYNNTATFNRIFIKLEGVSPKKWIENNFE